MALGNSGPLARAREGVQAQQHDRHQEVPRENRPGVVRSDVAVQDESETWTTPAVQPKISFARRNGSQKSRRQKPMNPMRPIARLAPATSC